MTRLLTEIQTAQMLGFSTVRAWKAALKAQAVPPPDHHFPDGPRWSVAVLSPYLGQPDSRTLMALAEEEALRRVGNGKGGH